MNQQIDEAVGKAFEKYLNGQFRELRQDFKEHKQKAETHWENDRQFREEAEGHWENNRLFQEELRPLIDALRLVQTFQKFLKWGGLTVAAFLAFIYWLFNTRV